jgi:hypothetical protein
VLAGHPEHEVCSLEEPGRDRLAPVSGDVDPTGGEKRHAMLTCELAALEQASRRHTSVGAELGQPFAQEGLGDRRAADITGAKNEEFDTRSVPVPLDQNGLAGGRSGGD